MKAILMVCLWAVAGWAHADLAEKGQPFPSYTLADPHGVTSTLSRATRFVIIASEKDVSGQFNAWLRGQEPGFLEKHRAEYVSDITPMPAIITTLFALPKMKKYPFRMLLADDPRFALTYPRRAGKLALFVLDENQVVRDIHFLPRPEELPKHLARSPEGAWRRRGTPEALVRLIQERLVSGRPGEDPFFERRLRSGG